MAIFPAFRGMARPPAGGRPRGGGGGFAGPMLGMQAAPQGMTAPAPPGMPMAGEPPPDPTGGLGGFVPIAQLIGQLLRNFVEAGNRVRLGGMLFPQGGTGGAGPTATPLPPLPPAIQAGGAPYTGPVRRLPPVASPGSVNRKRVY